MSRSPTLTPRRGDDFDFDSFCPVCSVLMSSCPQAIVYSDFLLASELTSGRVLCFVWAGASKGVGEDSEAICVFT